MIFWFLDWRTHQKNDSVLLFWYMKMRHRVISQKWLQQHSHVPRTFPFLQVEPGPCGFLSWEGMGRHCGNDTVSLLRLGHKGWYSFHLVLSWDDPPWNSATMLWGSTAHLGKPTWRGTKAPGPQHSPVERYQGGLNSQLASGVWVSNLGNGPLDLYQSCPPGDG